MVRDMSSTYWLDLDSSHGVGVRSVSAVCPRAGGISGRPCHEIIVVVGGGVIAVVDDDDDDDDGGGDNGGDGSGGRVEGRSGQLVGVRLYYQPASREDLARGA